MAPQSDGKQTFSILRVESVGPKVGNKLKMDGIYAILLACVFILIYIAIRFDWRYSPGAVIALMHDVFITMGVFSLFGIEFTLTTIAALLTIIGYSLNDTIVIYDRIRENWEKTKVDLPGVMNRSINETLSRTFLTSFTTFIAILPIFVVNYWTGGDIKWFSFAMMFGIIVGTYSSVGVASPTVLIIDHIMERRAASTKGKGKTTIEERRAARKRRKKIGVRSATQHHGDLKDKLDEE